MNADCKWVARIQNTNLKLFDKRLRQDLPGEYGTHIGREILLWDRYEFDADQINYHWSAHERKEHKQLAVVLTATHYREDMLTIQIGRYVPVNVLLSPQTAKFGTQEWNEMRKKQSERRVVFTSGNEGLTITNIPWSERDEIVSVHGRRLVKWLLGWFEECFGVKPVCDISDEVVNEIESQELTGEYRLTEDGNKELRQRKEENSELTEPNLMRVSPSQRSGKDRAKDFLQRVKLSIVDWLIKAGSSQSDACLTVAINDPKTYRTYRDEGLLLGESQLGVSFESLYEMYEQNKLSQWVRNNAGKWRENSNS